MAIATRPFSQTGGNFGSPKIDLGGCVLYAPLWRPNLVGSPFNSSGVYGIPIHPCTVVGATWGAQGRTFDGSDDRIVVTDAPSLRIIGNITAIAWVKPTANADGFNRRIISKLGASTYVGEIEFFRALTTGLPVMTRGNSTSNETSMVGVTALATNTWVQLAAVASGTTWTIYLNAVLDKTDTITQTVASGSLDLSIGARWEGNVPFPGVIGDVLLYNRALTLSEIQQNYLATKWRYS